MITIQAQGKVRQPFIKQGMQEFLKRIQKYNKVIYTEVKSLTVNSKNDNYVIALDENGKQYTSQKFATHLKSLQLNHKNITFLIGEAQGLPTNLKCNEKISLSQLTFPTQLARLIFIEQLYRAFTIIKGEPYHKE